jgi:small subunit ribosomal protein S3
MGQKTHPSGSASASSAPGDSKWYEEKNYAKWLHEDLKLRASSRRSCTTPASRTSRSSAPPTRQDQHPHRAPGIVIGKRGAGVEQLKKEVQALTENEVFLNIQEVRKAETNAQLVAENIATQLERRVAFRRAMKKACRPR